MPSEEDRMEAMECREERRKRFGAWTANESDPGVDGGAPTIVARIGPHDVTIGLSRHELYVAAIVFDEIGDFVTERGAHVAPWTRAAVLCVLEAAAAVAIVTAKAIPCGVCGGIDQGHTCCHYEDPTMLIRLTPKEISNVCK